MLPFFTLNVQAPPPWHVCPHRRQPFDLDAHAESGAAADTGLMLTTKTNRGSGRDVRKMNVPLLL